MVADVVVVLDEGIDLPRLRRSSPKYGALCDAAPLPSLEIVD